MEEAWPEEHLAKLSVNALIGLWARNVDLVYLMRTSNNQLDGHGCQCRQTFVDAAGQTHWDHIFVTQLFSNASHRPAWDFVMAAEYCAVARIRQMLAEVPMRYLKFLKTDCLGLQDLPKKYWPAVERLTRLRHHDGTPVYRCEQVEQLRGHHFEPEIQAWPPQRRGWERGRWPTACRGAACCSPGCPAPERRTSRGASWSSCGRPAMWCSWCRRPHWVRRTVRNGRCQLDWLVIEEVTQMDKASGPTWPAWHWIAACGSCSWAISGSCRRCWTALPGRAWSGRSRTATCCGTSRAASATSSRRTAARTSASSAGFGLGKPRRCRWPRRGGPAPRRVPGALPRPPGSDQRAGEPAPGARGRRGDRAPGAGRAHDQRPADDASLARAVVRVADADAERVTLDGGQQFAHAELLRHTRLCHAITYASCQGLTLRGRVWLLDCVAQHFNLRHLYVGASRATSSELLSVL